LRSRYPVASLWAAAGGADPALSDRAEVDMRRGEEVAVLRPLLAVDVRLLPRGGHAFMAGLAEGAALGQAAAQAAESCADFDLAAHLQGLFQLGAVVAVHAPNSDSLESVDNK
jgi:hypothetical protein